MIIKERGLGITGAARGVATRITNVVIMPLFPTDTPSG
jgi:hypothetical protein